MNQTAKSIIPVELLAPAKNAEVGRVAICAGADAVYIGGPSFGARKAAGNSVEDIASLCRYAHFYGAKVLVTLNTLLHENEYAEAIRLAYEYRRIGVDAIIIQDLRLAEMLFASGDFNGENGGIRLHASTQCDNRTLERVQELEQMGFRRVVLARELSYEEISHIRKHTTCELESFVHGALCVSYSGACYLSENVCGRSANRGECAQMCRLQYDVLDANKQEMLHQKHILSLKDLDRSASLRQLLLTGVTTLKIEGRLKDADYVRNVVAYYRQLLDRFFNEEARSGANPCHCAASAGNCTCSFTPNPEKTFHRGATDYFSFSRPAQLVNQDTPKSTGEYIGTAPLSAQAISTLHNGDGLTFAGEGFYWPNSRIRIPAGTPVFRNFDAEFQRMLDAKDATVRTLPVSLLFEETPAGFALTITPMHMPQKAVRVEISAKHTPAQNAERAESVVRQQLSKLGGTRLEAADITIRWAQPLFLPAALLNDLRRQTVEALTTSLEAPHHYDEQPDHTSSAAQVAPGRSLTDADSSASQVAPGQNMTECAAQVAPDRNLGAPDRSLVMTCKYCILHEMGCCKQKNPHATQVPTFLRGQNGLLLRIHTHCRECYMTLTRE